MGTDATLVAASRILLQYVQQFGLDPFLGTPRFVVDFPSPVVSPVLIIEQEQRVVGIARAAVGGGADLDRFLVIRDSGIVLLLFLVGAPRAQ